MERGDTDSGDEHGASAGAEPSDGGKSGIPDKLLPLVPVIVTGLAAYYYVCARWAFEQFYAAFGVTPEDVGLGYAETLTRSSNALLIALAVSSFGIYVLWALGRTRSNEETSLTNFAKYSRNYLSVFVAILSILLAFLLITPARILRERVQEGQAATAKTSTLSGWSWSALLGVRAYPVTLDWIDGTPPRSVNAATKHKLMYLGASGGTVVLYDVDARQTLRLPEDSIVITETISP